MSEPFRLRSADERSETLVMNLTAGTLAGLLTALGGALKDAPYEGFRPGTFMRSILVGVATGYLSGYVTGNFFLAFAFSGYVERLAVEGFKILRQRQPGKFLTVEELNNFIPPIVANREHLPPPPGTPLFALTSFLSQVPVVPDLPRAVLPLPALPAPSPALSVLPIKR